MGHDPLPASAARWPDYRAGYIGGNNSSWAERMPIVQAKLQPLRRFDVGVVGQCRCGSTEKVVHWRRVYCATCGARPDSRSELVRLVMVEWHHAKIGAESA